MAYQEYFKLYLDAQKNSSAPYYMVSFDVINSKLLSDDERFQLQSNINIIMKYVYSKLLESEKLLNQQVLISDKRFFRPWELSKNNRIGFYMDPYCIGDSFQFTVLSYTITKSQIIGWVNECKKKLKMKEDFHIADAYYETNEYSEGKMKFFRGYCIQTLEAFHKEDSQKDIKKL